MNNSIDIVVVDKKWQYPAITEKHAYEKVKQLVPYVRNIVYFAFPWATLIDLLDNGKPEAKELLDDLSKCKNELKKYSSVLTVCQHIRMLKHKELFESVGVTNIFWSHATKSCNRIEKNSIDLHPFPLYPTKIENLNISHNNKKYLFSFIGAKANKWYLTESRNKIVQYLSHVKKAFVKSRDKWHYNDIVYEHQIHKNCHSNQQQSTEKEKENEYLNVLNNSVFSLCPGGTGPNSIRLWESIEMGVIPVILSDSYLPPGDNQLWVKATISCTETDLGIQTLPNRLSKLAENEDEVAAYLKHLRQLKQLYGKDVFVTGIIEKCCDLRQKDGYSFYDYIIENSTASCDKRSHQVAMLSYLSDLLLEDEKPVRNAEIAGVLTDDIGKNLKKHHKNVVNCIEGIN